MAEGIPKGSRTARSLVVPSPQWTRSQFPAACHAEAHHRSVKAGEKLVPCVYCGTTRGMLSLGYTGATRLRYRTPEECCEPSPSMLHFKLDIKRRPWHQGTGRYLRAAASAKTDSQKNPPMTSAII